MDPRTVADYEAIARERLPAMAYDYYAGGAGDELTVRDNDTAWTRIRLRPRFLADVSRCDPGTTLLGRPVPLPLLLAPCAFHRLAHPEGELAVARAAAAAGIVNVLSTLSSTRLEDVAGAADGPRWFQLYCYRDREVTRALVERAEASGYAALCVTVDVPVPGLRTREARGRFRLPPGVRAENLSHVLEDADGSSLVRYVSEQFDPALTWRTLEWLRGIARVPIVLKGILAAEDARIASREGIAALCVSNHGGRQLDTVIATADALRAVVDAADGVEVLVDGGIRRGTDILKALAIGARGVMVGRPYLWGLAVDGEAGVAGVIELLGAELRASMALCGCAQVPDISRALLVP